ncbi:MAG: hypothetical protein AAFZ65_08370 [Planctomycetota bacterium]
MDWIRDALVPFAAALVGAWVGSASIAPNGVPTNIAGPTVVPRTTAPRELPDGPTGWLRALEDLEDAVERLEGLEQRRPVDSTAMAQPFSKRVADLERQIAMSRAVTEAAHGDPVERAAHWNALFDAPQWSFGNRILGTPEGVDPDTLDYEALEDAFLERHLGWTLERIVAAYGPPNREYPANFSEIWYSLDPDDLESFLLVLHFQARRLISVKLWN